MTLDEFLVEVKKLGCLLSNMYETDDGTWFVAARRLKPEWVVFYGRDKDREQCLLNCLRQAKRGKSSWPVVPEERSSTLFKEKPKRERVRVQSKIKRVRV